VTWNTGIVSSYLKVPGKKCNIPTKDMCKFLLGGRKWYMHASTKKKLYIKVSTKKIQYLCIEVPTPIIVQGLLNFEFIGPDTGSPKIK